MANLSGAVKQIWKQMTTGKGFDQVLNKIDLVSAQDGKCVAEMTVSEEHTNTNGTLHGGLTSTIVDVISGIALVTHKNASVGVSVDLHITFLNAAPLGERIVIEAKTNKSGKTLAFLDVEIKKKSNGQLLATGSHTKFVFQS
ncbi:Thioesterase superfamily [Nesidiocoris tenuis]|uniref:Thioesterase superfamily n=1 Tax=Nesidiocoris tenuis TaxID=355587 RepID=A0ABN7AGF9_9HEMI|nr:Thioesterase superfamily [Nesidiocoris tenuis]